MRRWQGIHPVHLQYTADGGKGYTLRVHSADYERVKELYLHVQATSIGES